MKNWYMNIIKSTPCFALVALLMVMGTGRIWGETTTLALCGGTKSNSSVSGTNVTFSISGDNKVGGRFADYNYMNSEKSSILSWSVTPGYTINVSKIEMQAGKYYAWSGTFSYYTSINSTPKPFCTSGGWNNCTLDDASYFGLGNTGNVTLSTSGNEFDYKNIKFYYTITNQYTITLNNQSATSAGTASITATYNSNTNLSGTPAITVPTKTDHTFYGYFTEKDGAGVQIIDASGNVKASVSGYTDASKNWIHVGDVTLYAKWVVAYLKSISLNQIYIF